MNIDIIEIPALRFQNVRYYSVLLEGRLMTEFRDFLKRLGAIKENVFELKELSRYIEDIGKYGAYPKDFKSEGAAEALPPPDHVYVDNGDQNDFGLRLYCIRVNTNIVILLNGDRKTALKVKDCKNCFVHFKLASKLSHMVTTAMMSGDIVFNEEKMELEIFSDLHI